MISWFVHSGFAGELSLWTGDSERLISTMWMGTLHSTEGLSQRVKGRKLSPSHLCAGLWSWDTGLLLTWAPRSSAHRTGLVMKAAILCLLPVTPAHGRSGCLTAIMWAWTLHKCKYTYRGSASLENQGHWYHNADCVKVSHQSPENYSHETIPSTWWAKWGNGDPCAKPDMLWQRQGRKLAQGFIFSMWWECGLLLRVACVVSLSQWHLREDHTFLSDGKEAGMTLQLSAVKHEMK